jgi:predicted PhzF superfamily epimerase YddE/YHI9
MQTGLQLYTVDAFTDVPFHGNPAAVCVLEEAASEFWMQSVANELQLSETAFIRHAGKGFDLRWFTPETEVDLCGHATLAAAFVLWETGRCARHQTLCFHTRSGPLHCTWEEGWVGMDFPALPCISEGWAQEAESVLGKSILYSGLHGADLLVEIGGEENLRALRPDLKALERLPVRGLIVTSRSASPEFDCVSRFFAPGVGINEDPVTGSAHCALAPYWSMKLGKKRLTGFQASRRGGVVRMALRDPGRVFLCGQAVLIGKTELSPAACAIQRPG